MNTKDIHKAIDYANQCATEVVQLKGVNTINGIL
jgi:sugar/nucleoside kinase (ribokinase family)